jgi:hypothetical protein
VRVCPCGASFKAAWGNERWCPTCRELRRLAHAADWLDYEGRTDQKPFSDPLSAVFTVPMWDVLDRELREGMEAVETALRLGASTLTVRDRPFSVEIARLELAADAKYQGCPIEALGGPCGAWPAVTLRSQVRGRVPAVALTDEQKAMVADLEAQGLSYDEAVEVATTEWLDVPVDGSGPMMDSPPQLLDE